MSYLPPEIDPLIDRLTALMEQAAMPWGRGHLGETTRCDCPYIFDQAHAGGVGQVYVDNQLPLGEGGNGAPPYEAAVNNLNLIVEGINALPVLIDEIRRLRRQE